MPKRGASDDDRVKSGVVAQDGGEWAPEREECDLQGLVLELRRELAAQRSALESAQEQGRKTAVALDQTHSELRLVSAALMTMQEKERQRIASELHDSIGQALNALSFGIGTTTEMVRGVQIEQSIEMLHGLAGQVKDTVEEVRRIAMDLRPAILDDLGIVGTLSWFFREFRKIYPHMTLKTEVGIEEQDVPVALRTPIYRVVQEAINNIIKHANAGEIHVVLGRRPPHIHLEINDNGDGFSAELETPHPGVARTGMGLTGMRSRVEFSGGYFHLESTPGRGATVRACWPLHSGAGDCQCGDAKRNGKAGRH